MKREAILKKLYTSIEKKAPLIGVSIGNGRSAIQAAKGGADILTALNAGRFRMAGLASIASTLPFANANQLVFNYASKEIVPRVKDVPVLFGATAQDPNYTTEELVKKITNHSFDGVCNFPTVSLIDGVFREALEEQGEGFEHEVNLIREAKRQNLFSVAFAVTMEECIRVVEAGADVLCLHFGWTYIHSQTEQELEPYIDRLIHKARVIFDEAKKINPKIITMIYGGSFVINQKVIRRFYEETGTVGYFGGSVFDTFPLQNQIANATENFKTMNRVSLLETENKALKELLKQKEGIQNILGQSREIKELTKWIEKISNYDANILIEGEIGTGKDLVAKAIHYNSKRAMYPIKKLNCASVPRNRIDIELFGYEVGAFSRADKTRKGLFEAADKGTVLLDNISELDKDTQAKILRVIQDGELERVGGNQTIKVDIRIVSTTTKNLKKEMLKGRFREDLFYLVNVLSRKLPPLREHREDIPIYVATFLEQIAERHHVKLSITDNVMNSFMSYDWPGNVRELKNVLERAVILSDQGQLDISTLPINFRDSITIVDDVNHIKNSSMIVEKELIINELLKANWNQTKVAAKIGVTRRTLYNKLKKYGISKKDYVK